MEVRPNTTLKARNERITRPTSPLGTNPAQRDSDWQPLYPVPASAAHLPLLRTSPSSPSFRTSYQNVSPSPAQVSIAFALSKLLSVSALARLLSDPAAFSSFHAYLVAFHSPLLSTLQLYADVLALRKVTQTGAAAARGVRDAYLLPGAEGEVSLGHGELGEAIDGLRRIIEARRGLEGTSKRLLETLFAGEFEGYVKHKLLAHTRLQLEKHDVTPTIDGLGEAFVLSNPRLPDQPIVLASPAFCRLTGYSLDEIVGRNCRCLQGEATSEVSTSTLRKAIKEHETVTTLLLNYTKQGVPFFNLLCILPIFDYQGELLYFVGGQTNITGALTASTGVALPSTANAGPTDDPFAEALSDLTLAPNPDLSPFSSAVRSAAHRPSSASFDTLSISSSSRSAASSVTSAADGPITPTSPVFVLPSDRERKGRPLSVVAGLASPSIGGLFKLGHKSNSSVEDTTATTTGGNGVGAGKTANKVDLPQGTIDTRIHTFTSTYERIVCFRTEGRRIVHASASFLRYLGLPGSRQEDVNASPLIDVDLLNLLRGVGEEKDATPELRKKVKTAVQEGKSLSVECGIRAAVEEKRLFSKSASSGPVVRGVLHLSPLQDTYGKAPAYVAIFA